MTPRLFLSLFLLALTVLRLALIGGSELFPDESYYFMWSERMDWSFFSKGPGVASAIWLGTHLFGPTEFGVRVLSPLLGLGTTMCVFALARRFYSEATACWAAVMVNCLPIFNAGSLVMTIDPLSIFFWSAALLTIWRALEKSPDFSHWWTLSGFLIGLGFLCKYTNALQLVSLVLLLAVTPRWRRELRRRGFWLLLAAFAVCLTPVIIWNAQHAWVTLDHLTARGGLNTGFELHPGEWLQFLGVHFGVYSPLIFTAFLTALWWSRENIAHSRSTRFLLAFSAPIFLLYFTLALKQAGEANWTAPGAISLGILTVGLWHERAKNSPHLSRFAVIALGIGATMSVIMVQTDLARVAGIPWPYTRDPSARGRGWRTLAADVEKFRAEFEQKEGKPVFLIANEHELAASLAFYMKDKRQEAPVHPPVYIPASPAFVDQFSFWPGYDQLEPASPEEIMAAQKDFPEGARFTEEGGINRFKGRTALYFTDRPEVKAPSLIQDGFQSWEMIACWDQTRRGIKLRQVRVFVCRNYLDPGVR